MPSFTFPSRKEYVVLYLLGGSWLVAMIAFRPPDKILGTWGGEITSSSRIKQGILLELNSDGSERINITAKQGSLVAIGSYEFSGTSLTQSIAGVRQQGAFNGPNKATVTGTFRCKVVGDTLELDGRALPLDKTTSLSSSDTVILTRLSENKARGNNE